MRHIEVSVHHLGYLVIVRSNLRMLYGEYVTVNMLGQVLVILSLDGLLWILVVLVLRGLLGASLCLERVQVAVSNHGHVHLEMSIWLMLF